MSAGFGPRGDRYGEPPKRKKEKITVEQLVAERQHQRMAEVDGTYDK